MKRNSLKAAFGIPLALFVFFPILGSGQDQTTKSADHGVSPGKSYSISDIETIGLQSGNLMLNVPLGSLPPGRGISAGVNIRYDSKIWDMAVTDITRFTTTHDVNALVPAEDGGWRYGYKYSLKLEYLKLSGEQAYCENGNNASFYPYKLHIVMPDGSKHQLYYDASNMNESEYMNIWPDGRAACSGSPLTGTLNYFTADGTFLRLALVTDNDEDWTNNAWTLYSPDGTRVIHDSSLSVYQRIVDRNGNYVDVIENAADSNYSGRKTTYIQDQMNRKVVIDYATGENEDEDWIRSTGFNGAAVITKVKWKTITVNKEYWSSDMAPSPLDPDAFQSRELAQNFVVVDRIDLPAQLGSGLHYTFGYNADNTSAADNGWGELNSVELPSGASADYEYFLDGSSGSSVKAEKVLRNRPVEKTLAYDLEYDGSASGTSDVWTYSAASFNNTLEDITSVTVTGPDGAETTEHYYQGGITNPPYVPVFVKGESYKTETPTAVLEKVYTSNTPASHDFFNRANRWVKYEFTTIKDNSGSPSKTAITEYSRDKNGNVTEVRQYDFAAYSTVPRDSEGRPTGLPTGATPARITKTDYWNETPDSASSTYTDADSYHLASSPRLLGLVKSTEVQNGSGTPKSRSEITYDHTSYSSNTVAGNPTATKSWDSFKGGASRAYSNPLTSTNSVSTSVSYNAYGMPTVTADANGVQTTVTYGCIDGSTSCSSTLENLYPTKVEKASNYSTLKLTSSLEYDFTSGLPVLATDQDNSISTATYYDELGRPTKVASASGTDDEVWIRTEYDVVNRRVITRADVAAKGDGGKVATQFFDQLGRVRLTKSLEDAATQSATNETDGIKVQTRYLTESGFTYQLSSNPYRANYSSNAGSEESMGWTRSKAWNTGIRSEVETFSGASLPAPWGSNSASTGVVRTDLDADRTLVTDQAGKQRISKTNGIGQLKEVWEIVPASDSSTESVTFPGTSIAYGYKTGYVYDTLNNLATVNQGAQTRSFTYSSLSRLLTAQNPESGTISYVYDSNGNLTGKTDARSITTSYSFDALNRVTQRTYSDSTLPVYYTYDNLSHAKGKLTKVTTGSGSTPFSLTEYTEFDTVGRVKKSKQTTDGTAYNEMEYTYNLSGAMVEEKYPSGRVVKNVLDAEGRLQTVKSQKNENQSFWNYANHFTYTPAGAVASMQFGNGTWEKTAFNSRLQPTQIALGKVQNTTDLLKLDYTYGVVESGTLNTAKNNGNIQSQTITVQRSNQNPLVLNQSYVYDSLNRLKSAEEVAGGSSAWKQTYSFDRYGNRNFDQSNTSFPTSFSNTALTNPTINASDNRFASGQGYTYDASGNVLTDAEGRSFAYDAENKQKEVKNASNQTIGLYYFDGDGRRVKKVTATETVIFIFDAPGKLVAEYSTNLSQTPQVQYLTNDQLGTPRINTNENGAVVSRTDYMPYGEEIIGLGGRSTTDKYVGDDVRQGFTGYLNDEETNLDYAQARMYKKELGRFTSTDPIYIESRRISDPQRINTYLYSRNNPTKFTDSTGLDIALDCNEADCKEGVEKLNKRTNASFSVSIGKGNKLKVGKVDKSKLNPSERALYDAITGKGEAKLVFRQNTGRGDFAINKGKGVNEIDLENVSQLDAESNKGGLNSGDAIAHEAVEAFLTLSKELTAAHDEVSRLFPGLGFPTNNYNHITKDSDGFREIPFSRFSQEISDGRGSMQVTVTYDTPIPAHAIDPAFVRDPEQRRKEVEVAGPRVTKVQFIPKPAVP